MGVFTRRKSSDDPTPSRSPLVASASRENLSDRKAQEATTARRRQSEAWQKEAWEYHDDIGEISYGFSLVANIASQTDLIPAVVPEGVDGYRSATEVDDLTPRILRASQMALAALRPEGGTTADVIHDIAMNYQVAGECYLMRTPRQLGSGTFTSWNVRSVSEIRVANGKTYFLPDPVSTTGVEINEATGFYLARLWNPHPRYSTLPHSSMRGVLDLCAELQLINTTFRSTARSRLNSGLLFIPDTLTVTGAQGYDDIDGEPEEEFESFETELMDSMTTPIEDETSASAVVPLLVRGPSEAGAAIKYLQFERSFDEQLRTRADRVLERIMQGIDLPKDVVTGLANIKYSNAIKIEESLYRQHVEPLMRRICSALTTAYLRPVLEAQGFSREQALRMAVWYDPSSVVSSPNMPEASRYAHENYLISDEAWLRLNGFETTDTPDGEEIVRRVAISKGQVLPEYLDKVLQVLSPETTAEVQAATAAESPQTALPPEVVQALTGKPTGVPDNLPEDETTTPPTAPPATEETPA
jgi:hypothetical protein